MPVIEGGQVLRGGQDFGGVLGGQVLYGGQEIEPEQGGRTQPDSEAVEMSVGPFRRSGAPPNGWYNGVADKGAIAVDIATGTHYVNTGTKAATVWTADAPSGGGSGMLAVSVPVTGAELIAIRTAPKTMVAAPGANAIIVPVSATIRVWAGSDGWVAASPGSSLYLYFPDDFHTRIWRGTFSDVFPTVGDPPPPTLAVANPPAEIGFNNLAPWANLPLLLGNDGGDNDVVSAGNGTAQITVAYSLATAP